MPRLRIVTLIILAFLFASCSSQPDSASGGPTPTPLPTTTAPQFPVVAAQACQLARFPALRTRYPQGDLIAWSPDSSRLAFVGPVKNSNWFAGKLHITRAPDFSSITDLASDILTFGDLTWSPDGFKLAYVLFRQPDVYSVGVTDPENSTPVDLLTAADPRTDTWSSSKTIQGWQSPTILHFLSSCGDDCDQTYEIDIQSGQITSFGEQLRKAHNRLWPEPNERKYDETIFPVMWQPAWDTRLSPQMKRPTWTQDGDKVAYIDRFIVAWVLRADRKEQYALDTPYVDVQELKWSPDGRYLALRTDDDVYIYDTECKP